MSDLTRSLPLGANLEVHNPETCSAETNYLGSEIHGVFVRSNQSITGVELETSDPIDLGVKFLWLKKDFLPLRVHGVRQMYSFHNYLCNCQLFS